LANATPPEKPMECQFLDEFTDFKLSDTTQQIPLSESEEVLYLDEEELYVPLTEVYDFKMTE
jgi:hypothetical protein